MRFHNSRFTIKWIHWLSTFSQIQFSVAGRQICTATHFRSGIIIFRLCIGIGSRTISRNEGRIFTVRRTAIMQGSRKRGRKKRASCWRACTVCVLWVWINMGSFLSQFLKCSGLVLLNPSPLLLCQRRHLGLRLPSSKTIYLKAIQLFLLYQIWIRWRKLWK